MNLRYGIGMDIRPVVTPLLRPQDPLAEILARAASLEHGDVLCVSSKAVATVEGAAMALPMEEAVARETRRMNGEIITSVLGIPLARLRPAGMAQGVIYAPNAGVDSSNAEDGTVVGWPLDPPASAKRLRQDIREYTGKNIAVIVTDSCCTPGRLGVTAFALAVSGMEPHRSLVGAADLFGKKLRVTHEAVADQLATAANAVMGNGAERTPAAVLSGHGALLSDFTGWVPGIEPRDDIYPIMMSP
jgi:coenzyme F420-0:L-glutamate ligase / coenzyme F420-1:gamma-L-glutamate ligase